MTPPEPVGRHLIADLSGVDPEALADPGRVLPLLEAALARAGFRCLERMEKRFGGGGGYTAVILLAESHAAVHTYPERGYLALDLFTCGPLPPRPALDEVLAALAPASASVRDIERSADPAPSPGEER